MAVKCIYKNPFFVYLRKHSCPKCTNQLKTKKMSRVVNSRSPETKNFDFYNGESFMISNVKFIWTEFKCPLCGISYTIEDIKKYEKSKINIKKKLT